MTQTTLNQVRIEYDDDQLNVIEKINRALKQHGLALVDDDLPHEGFCLFTLQISEQKEPVR